MAFKLIAVFKLNRLSAFISLKLASSSNVVNSICKWPTVQIELSVMHIWIEEKTINIIIIITIGIYLTLKMLLVEPQKKKTKPNHRAILLTEKPSKKNWNRNERENVVIVFTHEKTNRCRHRDWVLPETHFRHFRPDFLVRYRASGHRRVLIKTDVIFNQI